MAVLVLGGTGFIGTRVAERLAAKGEQVVCFDLFPDLDRVCHLGDKVRVVAGDVTRIEDIIASIREFQIESIINLAYLLAGVAEDNLHLSLRVNVMGMNNVFEAARLTSVRRVVYASSITVYGPQSLFGERSVTETDLCQPTLVYGAQKLWNEFMADRYTRRYGLDMVGTRVPVVSGPEKKRGVSTWASTYADNPALGKPARIPFRSNQRASIAYVDDIAEVFVRLCIETRPKHSIYNAYGHSVTLSELAQIVRRFLPGAEIEFDENAADMGLIYNCSSQRFEEEFLERLPPIEEMVKRHINEVRRKAGLSEVG